MTFCIGIVVGAVVGFLFGIAAGLTMDGGTSRVPPLPISSSRHILKDYGIR